MRRSTSLLLLALALAPVAGTLVACGNDEKAKEAEGAEGSEAEREEAERAEAAKQIAVEDRVAYYQLTTTSGLLRSTLQTERAGQPLPVGLGPAKLRAAESRVRRTEPQDTGLKRARARLLVLLHRVAASAQNGEAAARDLAELESVNAALSRFLAREPAQSVLIPD